MIFRNPKNGEIYDLREYCCSSSGFCKNIICSNCKINENRGEKSCREFVINDPYKAAELMGYEVVSITGEEGEDGDPKGIEFNKETSGKLRPSLVPPAAVWNVAAVREWAVENKYNDPDGWRKVPEEQYRDAMFRHMLQEWEKPGSVDKESGLPHLWHMLTNAFFIAQLRSEKHE